MSQELKVLARQMKKPIEQQDRLIEKNRSRSSWNQRHLSSKAWTKFAENKSLDGSRKLLRRAEQDFAIGLRQLHRA
jgi:hypothetical protein